MYWVHFTLMSLNKDPGQPEITWWLYSLHQCVKSSSSVKTLEVCLETLEDKKHHEPQETQQTGQLLSGRAV